VPGLARVERFSRHTLPGLSPVVIRASPGMGKVLFRRTEQAWRYSFSIFNELHSIPRCCSPHASPSQLRPIPSASYAQSSFPRTTTRVGLLSLSLRIVSLEYRPVPYTSCLLQSASYPLFRREYSSRSLILGPHLLPELQHQLRLAGTVIRALCP
jgi:hypothetical protein